MNWLLQLNQATKYIEEHLTEEISLAEIAKITYCSNYQFQRMFSYITGISLSEYIRNRRMTAAAFDLQRDKGKISDIALKYGYQSPTAFNRAFHSVHGIAPSLVRKEGVELKNHAVLHFHLSVSGAEKINYRIESKEAFKIAGFKMKLGTEMGQNFYQVPLFWERTKKQEVFYKLFDFMEDDKERVYGVSGCQSSEDFYYYIGVKTTRLDTQKYEEFTIPALTWVVFECSEPTTQVIQKLYQRIYTEWFPASGYERAQDIDIESYGEEGKPDIWELWIPIKKKETDNAISN